MTSLYAAVLSLLLMVLSVRVILQRRKSLIGLGDGGNLPLQRAIRAHANFIEYVPLCLLLIYFVEKMGNTSVLVHILGTILLIGRISHAYGISQIKENLVFRVFGMISTFTVIGVAAVSIVIKTFW